MPKPASLKPQESLKAIKEENSNYEESPQGKSRAPHYVEAPTETYVDRLIDEANHVKIGSPLKASYKDSPIIMYKNLKKIPDMDIM